MEEITLTSNTNELVSIHDMLTCYMEEVAKKNGWTMKEMYNFPDYRHSIDVINKIGKLLNLETVEL